MTKNNEGKLTEHEDARFKALLDKLHKVTLYNYQILVEQKPERESRHRGLLRGH